MIVGRPRLASLFAHIARRAPRVASAWLALMLTLGLVTVRPIAGGSPGLSFAHGAIEWLATDAATTVYTVSGLPFQPKALRFFWNGLESTGSTTSTTLNARRGMGFATSPSSRRAVGTEDQDAALSMVCTSGFREDCVAFTVTSTPAFDGLLDLDSITSDGFTLIVDDQAPVNVSVFWEAWGGADITVAVDLSITEPAAAGNVDYTVTGFEAGDTDDQIVFFAGVQSTAAAGTAQRNDSGFMVGFASGGAAGENAVILGNNDDGSANSDTDGYGLSGECLAMITVAGGNPNARAQLTQFNANGFRLNWIARGVTSRRYIALAIKGGSWRAGGYNIDLNAETTLEVVTGLPFTPLGITFISANRAASTAGTSTAEDDMSFGVGSGSGTTISQRCLSAASVNGASSADIILGINQTLVLMRDHAPGDQRPLLELNEITSGGFKIRIVAAVAATTHFNGYVAFGDAPVITFPPLPGKWRSHHLPQLQAA